MQLRVFFVNAFVGEGFQGNPAAVILLRSWLPDAEMQAIATRNGLSETAFLVPADDGYHLRWFTPTEEDRLCGHATLASAFVLFHRLHQSGDKLRFHTFGGELQVERGADRLHMRLPSIASQLCTPPAALFDALHCARREVLSSGGTSNYNYYVIFDAERELRALAPDLRRLQSLHPYGVAVTAPGEQADFVSRYFAPSFGIPEDPVTGSIHCVLTDYWTRRLGREELYARQISARGGELFCRQAGIHVLISGRAALYNEGQIEV